MRTSPVTVERPTSFAVPGYRLLWATGLLWHVARWMSIFATTYRVNEQTNDPLLVQLVGVAFMAPMFFGGIFAGTISDRLDRYRTVTTALGVLVPLAAMMALAVQVGSAPIGVSYLFIGCIGIGNVLDMTTRRSIAFGMVGVGLVTNAAAFETLALHAGNLVGSISGGLLLQSRGAAAVYLGVGICYSLALSTFLRSKAQTSPEESGADDPSDGGSMVEEFRAALRIHRSQPLLWQFLVTTVVMNFFFYSFTPLIPAFADDLGVGPFLTGALAGALGAGTMIGAFVISRLQPSRRGLVHVAGSAGAMTMLIVFANVTWYPAALGALFVAGLLGSGFGTTQAALVISLVGNDVRGRALGAMSMAIGSLPFGMLSLGLIARRTNPQLALTVSVAAGLVILLCWHLTRPALRKLQ